MYKKPDFPPNFPEELKAEILSKLDKVDKAYEGWKEKLSRMEFEELIGLASALDTETERREALELAKNPLIRKAVLESEKGAKENPTKPSFGFRVPDNGSVN